MHRNRQINRGDHAQTWKRLATFRKRPRIATRTKRRLETRGPLSRLKRLEKLGENQSRPTPNGIAPGSKQLEILASKQSRPQPKRAQRNNKELANSKARKSQLVTIGGDPHATTRNVFADTQSQPTPTMSRLRQSPTCPNHSNPVRSGNVLRAGMRD